MAELTFTTMIRTRITQDKRLNLNLIAHHIPLPKEDAIKDVEIFDAVYFRQCGRHETIALGPCRRSKLNGKYYINIPKQYYDRYAQGDSVIGLEIEVKLVWST